VLIWDLRENRGRINGTVKVFMSAIDQITVGGSSSESESQSYFICIDSVGC
jgi:hypothetical protein